MSAVVTLLCLLFVMPDTVLKVVETTLQPKYLKNPMWLSASPLKRLAE
jgi:hypothetical protein